MELKGAGRIHIKCIDLDEDGELTTEIPLDATLSPKEIAAAAGMLNQDLDITIESMKGRHLHFKGRLRLKGTDIGSDGRLVTKMQISAQLASQEIAEVAEMLKNIIKFIFNTLQQDFLGMVDKPAQAQASEGDKPESPKGSVTYAYDPSPEYLAQKEAQQAESKADEPQAEDNPREPEQQSLPLEGEDRRKVYLCPKCKDALHLELVYPKGKHAGAVAAAFLCASCHSGWEGIQAEVGGPMVPTFVLLSPDPTPEPAPEPKPKKRGRPRKKADQPAGDAETQG